VLLDRGQIGGAPHRIQRWRRGGDGGGANDEHAWEASGVWLGAGNGPAAVRWEASGGVAQCWDWTGSGAMGGQGNSSGNEAIERVERAMGKVVHLLALGGIGLHNVRAMEQGSRTCDVRATEQTDGIRNDPYGIIL
jgi:hypothetical protein